MSMEENGHIFFEGGWYDKKEIAAHIIDLCEGKISDKHDVNDTGEMTIAKNIFELLMAAEKRFGVI